MTEKVDSLLTLAEEDYELAFQQTTPPRPAAYHISQAAEKAARAVCVHAGIEVGPTHNTGQIGAFFPLIICFDKLSKIRTTTHPHRPNFVTLIP